MDPVGLISSGLGLVNSLTNMFGNKRGAEKTTATEQQKNIGTWAHGIESQVMSGEMDADTAIAALQQLMSTNAGVTDEDKRGIAEANRAINQIIANIQMGRQKAITGEYTPGENLTGNSQTQRERGSYLMRNMLTGTDTGKQFQASSPAGKLLQDRADPGTQFQGYLSQVAKPRNTTEGDALGSRILGALNTFTRGNQNEY